MVTVRNQEHALDLKLICDERDKNNSFFKQNLEEIRIS